MRLHEGVFRTHMFGQINGHRRWCLTGLSAPFERDAHGVGMRRSVRECVLDRGLQFAWSEAIEQPQQFQGDRAQIAAARRRAHEELLASRHRVGEAISTAMLARLTLAGNKCSNVALIFELCSAIVAARMLGNDLEAVKNAHAVGRRAYRYDSLRVRVRNAIIVKIKTRIRRLANMYGNDVIRIERVIGQREQLQLFVLKGFSNAQLAIGRADAVGGLAVAPQRDLRVEIGEAGKGARGKEAVTHVANGTLDAAFLITARRCDGARFVAVMLRELHQCRIKLNGVALPPQDDAAQVIIQQDPRQAVPGLKRRDVPAQKALHARVQKELHEHLARPRQNHHEGPERPTGTPNLQMAKVPPINLSGFARHAREAQISPGCAPRSMHRYNVSKMIGTSAVAAFAHHRVETASGQRWKALQRLENERYVRIGFGGSCRTLRRRHARTAQHSLHRSMMNLELARDRADPPLFNVIIAQNLCFEFRRYTHKCRSLIM